MFNLTLLRAALCAALIVQLIPATAMAAAGHDKELAAIRAQIGEMKSAYEARLQALEQRLQHSEATAARVQNAAMAAPRP